MKLGTTYHAKLAHAVIESFDYSDIRSRLFFSHLMAAERVCWSWKMLM